MSFNCVLTLHHFLTINHFEWLKFPGSTVFLSLEMRLALSRPSYTKLAGTLLALFVLSQLLRVEKYFEHPKTSQKYSNILTLLEQNF